MKSYFFILSLLLFSISYSFCQDNKEVVSIDSLYGNWKCVKLDIRGYEKYSLKQAKKLQASILTIEKNTFYYKDITFIDSCHFYGWKIKRYDTTEYNLNLSITYTKKELARMFEFEPIDTKGEWGCYNNCTLFFLKDDTLINNCGGYYLYFLKVKTVK